MLLEWKIKLKYKPLKTMPMNIKEKCLFKHKSKNSEYIN